jgi:hypothetical protein
MKVYTSYWAKVKNFPTNLVGLNTTVWPPKYRPLGTDARGVTVLNCKPLVPGNECNYLCRGTCKPPHPEDCAFLQTYRKQLDKLNFTEFYTYMEELSKKYNNADFAFIVFEPPVRACSERIVIQQWFRDNNVEINEW